jgi:hypothetical protein
MKSTHSEIVNFESAATPWQFSVMCPENHLAQQVAFDRSTLSARVRSRGAIPLFCVTCGRHWDATRQQRALLGLALGSPARTVKPAARQHRRRRSSD